MMNRVSADIYQQLQDAQSAVHLAQASILDVRKLALRSALEITLANMQKGIGATEDYAQEAVSAAARFEKYLTSGSIA